MTISEVIDISFTTDFLLFFGNSSIKNPAQAA
ncbi:hypothetical protein HCH_02877 [Hahella chejuensis KCTC 2396]|uniref:Uncharacterized protein n=1 Tax=Hahella chejuensis (strain KCTC 2396) TaxID=349521 RepID=Q2SI72_HAHCH|nr:hypothetical protein HCH_02877 [Hahella chejuensis KCTC 2396]